MSLRSFTTFRMKKAGGRIVSGQVVMARSDPPFDKLRIKFRMTARVIIASRQASTVR